MDDLSNTLYNAEVGCHINNCCVSHVFYADELRVTAASPCGRQALLFFVKSPRGFKEDHLSCIYCLLNGS